MGEKIKILESYTTRQTGEKALLEKWLLRKPAICLGVIIIRLRGSPSAKRS
jgi:hypothetical protein